MCLMWLIVACLLGLMPCTRKPCGGRAFGVRPSPLSPPFFCWLFFVMFGGGVCGCVSWLGE